MSSIRTVSTAAVLMLSLVAFKANAQDHPSAHTVVPLHEFAEGQWVEKVSGDATKPGDPFVIRIHQDAGYIVFPHTHPIDENLTIVKGTWALGMGRHFDRSALLLMELGSFGIAPRHMAHIEQVHGIGPFSSVLLDPVFELTPQGIFLLTSLLQPGTPTTSSPADCFPLKVNTRVKGERGEGVILGARCSPANQMTQYWIRKANGERFWAPVPDLKPL